MLSKPKLAVFLQVMPMRNRTTQIARHHHPTIHATMRLSAAAAAAAAAE